MNKKFVGVLAVLTLGVSLAIAAPHGGKGGHGKAGFVEKMAQKLDLSEAQKLQIAEIHKSTREQNAAFFESARQTRQAFKEAKKAGDTVRTDALKATMDSQKAQMKQIREAEMQRVLQILTPAQREKFEAMKADRKDHGRRGKQN